MSTNGYDKLYPIKTFQSFSLNLLEECPFHVFQNFTLDDIKLDSRFLNFTLDCFECDSTLVQKWSDMLQSAQIRKDFSDVVIYAVNNLTQGSDSNLYRGLNLYIGETLENSCPASDSSSDDDNTDHR
eukprot:UN18577